jgi:dihydrofolate reductase
LGHPNHTRASCHAQDHRCHVHQPRRRHAGAWRAEGRPDRRLHVWRLDRPHFDEALGASLGGIFGRPFDLLLGRKTYEIFAAHWPHVNDPNDPIAGVFNRVTKYVASRSNPKLTWQNSRLLGEDVVASLQTLKGEDGPDLIVQGSGDLLQTLWKNGLVDEFSVLIFPVVLGKGKRLFGNGTTPAGLKLVKSQAFPTGVIVANYRPDGAVKTGDFQLAEPTEAELERRRTLT